MLLARPGAVLAFAGLGFVAGLDVDFFAMVPSATAGRPEDGEGKRNSLPAAAALSDREISGTKIAPAIGCRASFGLHL